MQLHATGFELTCLAAHQAMFAWPVREFRDGVYGQGVMVKGQSVRSNDSRHFTSP